MGGMYNRVYHGRHVQQGVPRGWYRVYLRVWYRVYLRV